MVKNYMFESFSFGADYFNWAQVVGMVSFAIGIFAFSQKNDNKLKLSLGCLFLCQTLHFSLLGSSTSAMANGISFVRTLISIKYHHSYIGWVFIALNIVWGAFLIESIVGVLPILGACFGTYGIFFLNGIKMRLAFMTGAICWITNNIIVGSIGGVLLESMVLLTNLVTIIRIYQTTNRPIGNNDYSS